MTKKCVGFCADGASANMGQLSGVASKFKRLVSFYISIHCIAHRCALVMTDATKVFKEFLEVDKVLCATHALFRSTKKHASGRFLQHATGSLVSSSQFLTTPGGSA